MLREDHDPHSWMIQSNAVGRLNPFHLVAGRHADVDDHSVWEEAIHRYFELLAVLYCCNHINFARRLEQLPGSLAHEIVVISDYHPHQDVPTGSRACSTVPAPGCASTEIVPDRAAKRSERPARPLRRVAPGSNPTPLSRTVSSRSPPLCEIPIRAEDAEACLRMLATPSTTKK